MTNCDQLPTSILRNGLPQSSALASGLLLGLTILTMQLATARTLTVLHTFSGPDGLYPYSGVTLDRSGNLYGTTYGGGADQDGTVYQLKRVYGTNLGRGGQRRRVGTYAVAA